MKYILSVALITLFSSIFSQKVVNKALNWNDKVIFKTENSIINCLNFQGAVYEDYNTMLPYYYEIVSLSKGHNSASVNIFNEKYEVLTSKEIEGVDNLDKVKENVILVSSVALIKKEPYLQIKLLPLRKNKTTGNIEKLISFSISITESNIKNESKSRVFQSNSVLQYGKWVRVEIEKDGIYKIDYSKLIEWGFENPQDVRIFGYGGTNLPMSNSTQAYDDLIENSISVEKGSDDVFNNGDYVLFYGKGSCEWKYNYTNQQFEHFLNEYSSKTYYYITVNNGPTKQIQNQSTTGLIANKNTTTFDDYLYVEKNEINLIKSGRIWLGERFDLTTSYDFPFNFADIDVTSPIKAKVRVVARSSMGTKFEFKANGVNIQTVNLASVNLGNYEGEYASSGTSYFSFSPTQSNINVNASYIKGNSTSEGWLDYIDLHARRNLKYNNAQLFFRDIKSVGIGNISEFKMTNANLATTVWDISNISDIKKIETNLYGNELTFSVNTDSLRQFVAFGSGFLTPKFDKEIANQNLHGLSAQNMIIVTHPDFLTQAEKLAEFHRQNDQLTVFVVTPELIYNEFSSGKPDISAIRNFMKMFYDRAGADENLMPKYLLLLGDGSFDNNSGSGINSNYILSYQSLNSLGIVHSYTSDDFFGLLDDDEGDVAGTLKGFVDVGIGRLPARSTSDADIFVGKIINYASNSKTMGDWRNLICLVGDDEDSNQHMTQANNIANKIKLKYSAFNIEKIFLDAYPQLSTPAGDTYPDVNNMISNRMKKGALIFNYIGHGNEVRFAHEGIIGISDVNFWENYDRLPFFITASCEISRWDDYQRVSIGELIFLNPNGGSVGLLSSSRLVYSGDNDVLNQSLFNNLFERSSSTNQYNKLGDAVRLAKSNAGSDSNINNRKFALLGDPALQLAIPEEKVITDSINSSAVIYDVLGIPTTSADTAKAFQKVVVSGHVANLDGSIHDNFNGTLYATVYDKAKNITTLANDGGSTMTFDIQDNILYKGKVSVLSGKFRFSFLIPKDISYNYGKGKISYYADNTQTDAQGYYNNIIIGGSSDIANTDKTGPQIKLYMNDKNFVAGGITNSSPKLLAYLSDSSGINTIGSGIGHDITCVIDDNTNKAIVLNDFYESDKDSYQSGIVNYLVNSLSSGNHTIKLKAWDVFNNSSEETLDFVIANSSELALDHVFNYPNPFTDNTRFYFYHNQPNTELNVSIQIFTVTGKLIKTINTKCLSEGNSSVPMFNADDLNWDGKDDYGDQIGRGVYIYKIKVKMPSGKEADKFEKLVILK